MKYTKIRKLNKHGHRSNLETSVLHMLKKIKGVNAEYECTKIPYTVQKNYVPDFTILTKDGRTVHIEVKGWFRPEDRVKMRAVKASNPTIDVRFVFGANNKLAKGSQMTYSDWCEKYDFMYAFNTIPKEWF